MSRRRKRGWTSKDQGAQQLARAGDGGTELRDGQPMKVVLLPEVKPNPFRSARSRYKLEDVGKGRKKRKKR